MKLLMARHGQSVWQVEGDGAGKDSPLTALGEAQAHCLGKYLAQNGRPDVIFASPLQRARRTAEIAASYLGLTVTLDPGLCEFEDWENGWAPAPVSMWDMSPAAALSPGYSRFRAQVLGAMQRIVNSHADGEYTVLVVAHGGSIGTLLRIALGSDTLGALPFNAALHQLEWTHSPWRDTWSLVAVNQMDHLPPELRTV